jgi:pyruvate/2-oxoglutarate dehydrogenase complex dihydrolipoamide dehydrogenase (E3) component
MVRLAVRIFCLPRAASHGSRDSRSIARASPIPPRCIRVDARLRTTNRRVYALGDVIGQPQFTHTAGYQAGILIRNVLFRLPAKVDYRALPWVRHCDSELAHVGLTEQQARERFGTAVQAVRVNLSENDHARTERHGDGCIKVVIERRGTILGAGIVGAHAGGLIGLWGLAITRRLKLSALTGIIFPYPTLGEISRAAASALYAPKLCSPWPKRLVRLPPSLP